MKRVKGWAGVGLMLTKPCWPIVFGAAALVPTALWIGSQGKIDSEVLLACPLGMILLAVLFAGDGDVSLSCKRGDIGTYVAYLAMLGPFLGMPSMLLGIPFVLAFDLDDRDRSTLYSTLFGGAVSLMALVIHVYRRGLSLSEPQDTYGHSVDNSLDGGD